MRIGLSVLSGLALSCHSDTDSGVRAEDSGSPAAQVEFIGDFGCASPALRESDGPMELWSLGAGWDEQPIADNLPWQYTAGGGAIADFNGDGRLDVYLPSAGASQLLLSEGAVWSDASAGLPATEETDLGVGGIVADVDDDGDLDIYTLVLHGQNKLLLNDGVGRFTDGTDAAGLLSGPWDTTHATFADVDGDGVLDLVVANHYEGPHLGDALLSGSFEPAHENRLFLGDGQGGFSDATASLPEAFRVGYGFAIVVEDFDGDGVDELLSVNDFGPLYVPNTVLRRESGQWQVDQSLLGLDVALYGMGAGIGDLNEDGVPDLLITSWGELALLESTGDGAWFRSAAARGLVMSEAQSTAWAAEFADIDNDLDLDALVAMGPLVMPEEVAQQQEEARGLVTLQDQPDALFLQGADGSFRDEAAAWGVGHPGISRGLLPVDIDGDGWLDIVRRGLDGPAVVWCARCGSASALVVSLSQGAPNRNAIGAVVEVDIGGRTLRRRVRAGGHGHAFGGPPVVHFGLSDNTSVDVRVTWPDGTVDRMQDVPAGHVRVTRR